MDYNESLFVSPVEAEQSCTEQMITLKMADQRRSEFCVVVTMSLWTLELKQTLIGLLFHNMRL